MAASTAVETLRKPSTGLKPICRLVVLAGCVGRDTQKTQHGIETGRPDRRARLDRVETLRKPSTGLKLPSSKALATAENVETLRKPSTGLKLDGMGVGVT